MGLTHADRKRIHDDELPKIIRQAHADELVYADLKRAKFSTGTLVTSYVEANGGIINNLNTLNIPLEEFLPKGFITNHFHKALTLHAAELYYLEQSSGTGMGQTLKVMNETPYGSACAKILNKKYGDLGSAAIELGLEPHHVTSDYINGMEASILEMYEEGFSGAGIQERLKVSATVVFEILRKNGVKAIDPPSLYLRKSQRGSVSAGLLFEVVLAEILTELGVLFSKYAHDILKPDFVLEDRWIDAKLSINTVKQETLVRYLKYTDTLELVYLNGPKISRKSKRGVIRTSVYILLNEITDDSKREYFEERLDEVRRIEKTEYNIYEDMYIERDREILSMVKSGVSMRRTASLLNTWVSTVSKVCEKHGVISSAPGGRPKTKLSEVI